MSLHGTARVRYFDHGSPVGEREAYCCGYSDTAGESHSAYWPHIAYFCPYCGEIWGREVLIPQFSYQPIPQQPWVIESRRCAKHGDGLFLTGKPLDNCSPELLRREALLLLNRYAQESQQ